MKTTRSILVGTLLAASLVPLAAHAAFVLATGTPTTSSLPMVLDGNDYYAAEFSIGAGQTISSVQAYLTAGIDQPGDTFTIAIYSNSDFGTRNAVQQFSGQATYTADGWNGLSNLTWTPASAGQYWAALEVGTSDTASGLSVPQPVAGGTAPALAYAFNAGSGYQTAGAQSFGIQVTSVNTVPLPAGVWLLGSGALGLVGLIGRRRKAA